VAADDVTPALMPYADFLIPSFEAEKMALFEAVIRRSRAVEIAIRPGKETVLTDIRRLNPDITVLARLPLDAGAAERAVSLTRAGIDSITLFADDHGREIHADHPRFLKDLIREVHLKLVDDCLRQQVNLVFSGGISMAEHVVKAMLCGADAVEADVVLMLALECRLCGRCREELPCPVALEPGVDRDWGSQRIVNLIGAWHSQIIEMMGAMGIREARRLRGEIGRSMWFEDLEKENFGPIFGERVVPGP
jgi:hypothetical protein